MTTEPPALAEGVHRLPDGRRIGFAEYGDPHGRVVVWFHGTPGGRGQIAPAGRRVAAERGVRLVALERPGIGLSSRHLYADVSGWADDVGVVLDQRGVDRFAAVGLSGGGPYVLACAARHPDRMVAGAVLGGVAPTRGPDAAQGGMVDLATRLAPLLEGLRFPLGVAIQGLVRVVRPVRSLAFETYVRYAAPDGDQVVFRRPGMKDMFLDDLIEACRRQGHAPVHDLVLFTRDWGFRLGDLRVPIRFWHGDADNIVPLAHAEHMATLVPDSELRIRPGESHLGSLDAVAEILDAIGDLWPTSERTGAVTS